MYPFQCVRNAEYGRVGVPEHTLFVKDRDLLRPGAPFDYVCGSVSDAVLTHGGRDITAAEEEAIGDVGWGTAGGEVVEAVGSVGVGGEYGEEGVEVCLVDAVLGVGGSCGLGCVWAGYVDESWVSSFDYWDEGKQKQKQANCVSKQSISGHFVCEIIH